MLKKILVVVSLLLCVLFVHAKNNTSFAIVVDAKTHLLAQDEINSYAQAIEEIDHLQPIILIDKWGVPDSIKQELKQLYYQKKSPIEGAVFIGDIPIALIRDAQHLTSAFKMDQNTFPWQESSVPSDRFYDDFALEFTFLKQDEEKSHYFYYSLAPQSAQTLHPNIYTGRIKAADSPESTKYEKIKAFLKKAVQQKYASNYTNTILFFSGNGYVSESMLARLDEKIALLENFPWLKHQKNGIEYIDHRRDKAIKDRLKTEMQRPDLDIAVLHHHGDAEIQYMNAIPLPSSTQAEIDNVKLYLRESLRHAQEKGKNIDSIQIKLSERYGNLPQSWFEGAFDEAQTEKDSLFLRSLDLFIDEFDTYRPNARLVVLDACFNGSFHKDAYIAGAYIFNPGSTVAVLANSVNVLQDKWHDRYIGLMALGMRAGRLAQYNTYLEGHLFGDPTFHFNPIQSTFDINAALAGGSEKFWKKQLTNPLAAVQAMALRKLVDTGKDYSDLLLDTYKTSSSFLVRMEAMVLLSTYNNTQFIECLQLAVDDSFELVQRFAINFIAKNGDARLIPSIISVAVKNNTSERSEFNIKMALSLLPEEALLAAFDEQFKDIQYYNNKHGVHKAIKNAIEVNARKWQYVIPTLQNDSVSLAKQIAHLRMLRNYTLHNQVPALLAYFDKTTNPEVQVAFWEALGWFSPSYQRQLIAKKALEVAQDTSYTQAVRDEALKTYNRLTKN